VFASILILEYFVIWKSMVPSNQHIPSETDVHCHDCWESSALYFQYCKNCWIGITLLHMLRLFLNKLHFTHLIYLFFFI
jgi:hypothetical protein